MLTGLDDRACFAGGIKIYHQLQLFAPNNLEYDPPLLQVWLLLTQSL